MSYFNRRKKLLNENLARAQQSERLGEALDLEQRVINRRLSHKAELAAADARLALGRLL
ncbi:MAG TPA: hypothetical protein VFG98_10040 [Intrasporangium sp.]|nr:hypothetical protein [Intrasporangium sp.]